MLQGLLVSQDRLDVSWQRRMFDEA
jgi:hypothetical protein